MIRDTAEGVYIIMAEPDAIKRHNNGGRQDPAPDMLDSYDIGDANPASEINHQDASHGSYAIVRRP